MAKRGFKATASSLVLGDPDFKKAFTRAPLRAASGAVLATHGLGSMVVAPIASAIRELLTNEKEEQGRRRLMLLSQARAESESTMRRVEAKRQYVQMNADRLRQAAPDIANRVLAGRRITDGGVAIGGRQRTDLLQELASYMADGSIQ
jgi:hypothetical protein